MSFPRYERYKDSGVEWLGEVPEGWEVLKLGKAAELQGGYAFSADTFDVEGVPVVRMNNLKRGVLDLDEAACIPHEAIVQKALLLAGDLLWGMSGSLGETGSLGNYARVREKDIPCLLNQRVGRFIVKTSSLSTDFLAYIIQSPIFSEQILLLVTGTAQFNVSSEQVQSCRSILPLLPEQQIIVAFLDRETGKIDALVAEQERLIALLMEKRQATISRAVTKGLNPDEPMKDSGIEWLGEVPVGWEVKRLGIISDSIQTGPFGSQLHSGDYVDGETPVINPSNIQDGQIMPDWSCTVEQDIVDRLRQHMLIPGDIVFGRRGEMGRCAMVSISETGWLCGTGSLNVRLKKNVSPKFVSIYLRTEYVRELLKLESVGSTMDNLNTEIISRVPVPMPTSSEQAAIVAFLDSETAKIDALVGEAQQAIGLLKERRSALISAAVTGKIDVRNLGRSDGSDFI